MTKRALLLGAYGQTNLGDDLLLYNYLSYISNKGFTHIDVNASEAKHIPAIFTQEFPSMHIFETYRTPFWRMISLMQKADTIFYGGGTVYKELYASTGRSRYSVILRVALFNILARLMGKKIIGLHIGIGSIKTPIGRLITKTALSNSTHTTFRDAKSFTYANETLRVAHKRISHSTDGLFMNKMWQRAWHTAKIHKKGNEPVVGINLLSDIPDWVNRDSYLKTMRQFIRELLQNGTKIVFLPFQTNFAPHNDLHFIKTEIVPYIKDFTNYQVASDVNVSNIVSYLQQIDILVGMRFHSLLLAAAAGTPFLAVAYDTKCWRFVQENNYTHALRLEDITTESLLNHYNALQKRTKQAKQDLHVIAEANFKTAQAWMQRQNA